MSTPVARQVRAGVGARAGIPSSAAERKAPPQGVHLLPPRNAGKILRCVRK